MSFWEIMNLVAWGLSIFLLVLMFRDFFQVERNRNNVAEGETE